MRSVKDLSIEELKALIAEVVEEKLHELLADPDAGLSLRPEIIDSLRRDLQEQQEARHNVSVTELARRLGLEW